MPNKCNSVADFIGYSCGISYILRLYRPFTAHASGYTESDYFHIVNNLKISQLSCYLVINHLFFCSFCAWLTTRSRLIMSTIYAACTISLNGYTNQLFYN